MVKMMGRKKMRKNEKAKRKGEGNGQREPGMVLAPQNSGDFFPLAKSAKTPKNKNPQGEFAGIQPL